MIRTSEGTRACELCSEIVTDAPTVTGLAISVSNRICFRSDRSVIMPSLGPLADGHLLLMPISHSTGLAFVDASGGGPVLSEIEAMTEFCRTQLGEPVLFEHGALSGAAAGGCGVTHAHLHAVPASKGAVPHGPPSLPGISWTEVQRTSWLHVARTVALKSGSYLYYRDQCSCNYVAGVRTLPSQTMRRYIATCIGEPAWDWRAEPKTSAVQKSAEVIRQMAAPAGFEVA